MKKPMNIKFDYFLAKHKLKVFIILMLLILSALIYGTYLLRGVSININSSLMGVFGAILGAIVAGVLALFGSIYVNNNQLKSKSAIHRKNVIYRPLYDELVEIRNIIKERNPYPSFVTLSKGRQTLIPHPQFSAWDRIKNDSRFIQTPKFLADGLEELYKKVEDYLIVLPEASMDVQNKINSILDEKHDTTCTIQNLGSAIIADVITKNKPRGKLFEHTLDYALNPKKELNEEELIEIEDITYYECHKLDSVQQTIKAYKDWLNTQDELINTLMILIKIISIKYEKLNGKY